MTVRQGLSLIVTTGATSDDSEIAQQVLDPEAIEELDADIGENSE
ncbi:MAG: hypothetical protein ABEJ57_05845 [Halobacteriaceae archaeon]